MPGAQGKGIGRWVALVLLAGLIPGCGERSIPGPVPAARASWRVAAIQPIASDGLINPAITLVGDPGFIRATLVVERPAEGTEPARTALYDHLFPIGREARLWVSIEAPAPPASAGRVGFHVDSAGATSDSFVEPVVPFRDPEARVTWTGTIAEGLILADGAETEAGRWTIIVGRRTTTAIVRLLCSRKPVGTRLKPEATPPV